MPMLSHEKTVTNRDENDNAIGLTGSGLGRGISAALLGLLVGVILVQWLGVFRKPIHWDEFLFLSAIYRAANGENLRLLQTSYVYLFQWLPAVGGDEITQINVARGLYVGLLVLSLGLLYRLGLSLLHDRLGALAGTALYALFPFVLVHAVSFRFDGLLLPCLLGVALLLLRPTVLRLFAAGLLGAAALALSIKAVLWAPAFLGILVFGPLRPAKVAKTAAAGAVAAVIGLVAIYAFRNGLPGADGGGGAALSLGELAALFSRMLIEEGILPNRDVFLSSLRASGATWLLIAGGAALAAADLRSPVRRRAALRLLFAASPVLLILVYSSAWPYAYVVLMPTACLLAGRSVSFLVRDKRPARVAIAIVALGAAAVALLPAVLAFRVDGQANQKQILDVVHRVFPAPVAYVDKTGMVSSFPGQPFPITAQVMTFYRAAGQPRLKHFIDRAEPPLLIVNTPVLDMWNGGAEAVPRRFRLLPDDERALRETYAHFWGPLYLAGRSWQGVEPGEAEVFEIGFDGTYTLLADTSVMVDGRVYEPGASIVLGPGRHRIESVERATNVMLLWGEGLELPDEAAGSEAVYAWYGGG